MATSSRCSSTSSARTTVALLALLLIAFGLRVYRLDGQSFWSDEGASAVMALRTVGEIVHNTAADIHPPLYYVLLSGWARLTGLSEFSLRFLSVGAGLIAVAAVVPLCRRLAPRAALLPAVATMAIGPFAIYYSQEARMYAPVLAFTAIAAYLTIRIAQGDASRFVWAGYVATMVAALYTQYFGFTIFAFASLAFVIWNVPPWRRFRRWLQWAGAQLLVLGLYVPWFPTMLAQGSTWPAISEPLRLGAYLTDVLRVFSWGLSWDYTATSRSIAFVVLVLAASLYWLARRWHEKDTLGNRSLRYLTLLLYLATPLGVMFVLSLQRPAYNPKLLIVGLPAFFILLGMGIAAFADVAARAVRFVLRQNRLIPSLAGVGAALVLLLVTAYFDVRALNAYYFIPKYARDDYRGLARLIDEQARPGDAIILTAPGQIEIFEYYYRGELPRNPLPKQRPIDITDTERHLEQLANQHTRLWMVRWAADQADPDGFIDSWLAANAYRTYDRWFGNVQLILYQVAKFTSTEPSTRTDLRFGEAIELQGYSMPAQDGVLAFEPGEVIPLTLFWQSLGAISERYTVFTHLVDRSEVHIWGQRDNEPRSGLAPTTTWVPGQQVVDNYGILVLPGTPPGEYEIEVGLYSSTNGQRLPLSASGAPAGDRFVIGPIQVRRPEAPPRLLPEMTDQLDLDFEGLIVLGFNFNRLGGGPEDRTIKPGEIAHLTLFLEAGAPLPDDLDLRVRLLEGDRVVHDIQRAPAFGNPPTSQWRPGEPFREQLKLSIDQPGNYRLLVGAVAPDGTVKPPAGTNAVDGMVEILRFEVTP